jgi:transglutaminase-like putative cysteine protease
MKQQNPTTDTIDWAPYLQPTYHIDSDHPQVRAYALKVTAEASTPVDKAVRLFEAVRDGIRYNPYTFSLESQVYKASETLARGVGFCIPKAVLLTALLRVVGIPTRLRFADVVNHLATPGLIELLQTEVFAFHGYNELYLDGRWVKATATFDTKLCRTMGVEPLAFDGHHDAVFHAFDQEGRKHMEYVKERGHHADLPFEEMIEVFQTIYPHAVETLTGERQEA